MNQQRSTAQHSDQLLDQRLDELIHGYLQQIDEGKTPDRAELLREHPALAGELAEFFADHDHIAQLALELQSPPAMAPDGSAERPPIGAGGGLPRSVRYFGRYEILQEIARGGMGVVYKARQSRLDRIVALKMILAGRLASAADVSRFHAEAQASANLEHPGIVPIYEVGQFAGQHYFSMAYVEGESLAARLVTGPLPQQEAAKIVRQLCEAVQYAHDRGVIHRDLKPANVLIDRADRARITDFGLAKQTASTQGLTATGEVLGTPSYMPPEQAAGDWSAMGPAADVYSLEAVLYAALTGRPPFQAATPTDTLLQVREADPVSPRLVNPVVKKDLETICLKCLEKDPPRRYASAAKMAEDLRRFLQDEPIVARRIGTVARTARWLRRRRKTVVPIVASAVLAAIVIVGAILAAQARQRSLLGSLSLSTDGPSLVAEIFDEEGRPAAASFPVPTSEPVQLTEGSYRLRFSSSGIVSQDYSLRMDRHANLSFDARMENRNLWLPLELLPDESVEPVASGTRTDLLVYRRSDQSLRLLGGASGKPVWPQDLVLDKSNLPAGESLERWRKLLAIENDPSQSNWLASAAADLTRRDDGPLVFASRVQPALIAVVKQTSAVQWVYRGQPSEDQPRPNRPDVDAYAATVGRPVIATANASAKAGPEANVVACFTSARGVPQSQGFVSGPSKVRTWLQCVSLKGGKSLWRYEFGKLRQTSQPWGRLPWALESAGQPRIATVAGRKLVVCAIEQTLYGVDLATGKEAWRPFDLGFQPDAAPEFVEPTSGAPLAICGSGRQSDHQQITPVNLQLTAISLDGPHRLWQRQIEQIDSRSNPFGPPSGTAEFKIEQIGRHGEPAIVAPLWHSDPNSPKIPNFPFAVGSNSITVIDPATGNTRWEQPLDRSIQAIQSRRVRWTLGPDLNGDGDREVFAAWLDSGDSQTRNLCVAAFSGRDGKVLWRWTQPGLGIFGNEDDKPQSQLCWWAPAEDGWPTLVVPIARGPGGQAATYILDAAAGQSLAIISGVSDPKSVDLNGDGLPDLFYTVAQQGYRQLFGVRGDPPTVWRPLEQANPQVADDLDGDGIADVIANEGSRVAILSGADGHTLWQFDHFGPHMPVSAMLPIGPSGQLRPAVLELNHTTSSARTLDAIALAGADGRRIWPASGSQSIQIANVAEAWNAGRRGYSYPAVGTCWLDPARPDVWLTQWDISTSTSSLEILAGDTGQRRWSTPIAPGQFGDNGRVFRDELQDLNGDGVRDIVAWTPTSEPTRCQLKAFSGSDGAPLWRNAPPIYAEIDEAGREMLDPPVVGRLDGKGAVDVVFLRQRPDAVPHDDQAWELVAADGRTGRVKWTWSLLQNQDFAAAPLLVDFDGSGRCSLCLFINEIVVESKYSWTLHPQVVIFDSQGKVRLRIDCKRAIGSNEKLTFFDYMTWWRKARTSNGKEVLLFDDGNALAALGGENLELRWKWPVPEKQTAVVEIFPGGKSTADTIAVSLGTSILGISTDTGKPIWRGEMLPDENGQPAGPVGRMLLADRHGAGLPRLLTRDGCRLLWPADAEGRYHPPPRKPRSY